MWALLLATTFPNLQEEDAVVQALESFEREWARGGKARTRIEAIRKLTVHKDARIRDALNKRAQFTNEPTLAAELVEALSPYCDTQEGLDLFLQLTSRAATKDLSLALEAAFRKLGELQPAHVGERIKELNGYLSLKEPLQAKAAVTMLARIKSPHSIEPLIDRLEKYEFAMRNHFRARRPSDCDNA